MRNLTVFTHHLQFYSGRCPLRCAGHFPNPEKTTNLHSSVKTTPRQKTVQDVEDPGLVNLANQQQNMSISVGDNNRQEKTG